MLDRIIEAVSPGKDDLIVEIGPGEGALTKALLERAAKIEVIELDTATRCSIGVSRRISAVW